MTVRITYGHRMTSPAGSRLAQIAVEQVVLSISPGGLAIAFAVLAVVSLFCLCVFAFVLQDTAIENRLSRLPLPPQTGVAWSSLWPGTFAVILLRAGRRW